mmetsp:Transcript_103564/g.167033  ORF Transcript_103564/g.167033 Transcript_103564/m.167033 type:complete len:1101 (+) Transcript_103564:87-3389(+)
MGTDTGSGRHHAGRAESEECAPPHSRRRRLSVAVWMATLLAGVGCMTGRADGAPGDVLIESRFTRDMDDWYTDIESQREDAPTVKLELDRGAQRIKSGDMGDVAWYFKAPQKFLGDQRSLFHGVLQYELGHYVFDMNDGPPSTAVPDVVMESKSKRLRLGAKAVIKPNVAANKYSVPFSAEAFDKLCRSGGSSGICGGKGDKCTRDEDCCSKECVGSAARWYNLKTGRAARNSEVLDVLSDMTVLKIRGGYYKGGMERTWMKNPIIIEGGVLNRTDALAAPGATMESLSISTPLLQAPVADATATPRRSRSRACKVQKNHIMKLRPSGPSQLFNQPFPRPWTNLFRFPNMPDVCTDATLIIEASGDLLGEEKFVQVVGEDGALLGRLFVTAIDFSDEADACVIKNAGDCAPYAGPDLEKNASVFMADKAVQVFALKDGIVVPRALMTRYTADGELTFGLRVEEDNKADVVTIISASIEFGIGGCYSRHAVQFPGRHGAPRRYSGYFTSLKIPSPVVPDDDGAIMINATGVLAPETSWVSVALSNVSDPGPYGPRFAAVTYDGGLPDTNRHGHPGIEVLGSQSEIEETGTAWKLLEATRVFAAGLGDQTNEVGAVWNSTRKEAGSVSRELLAAMAAGEAGDGAGAGVLAVIMRGHPAEPSHTDFLSLWEASLVYPPASCAVHTMQEGQGGPLGLMGHPLEREIEYCDDYWLCDSVGPSNNQLYTAEALCRAHCWRQRGGIDHPLSAGDYHVPSPGYCYQPLKAMGHCATATDACSCTKLGVAECATAAGADRKLADGSCRCIPFNDCARSNVNVTYPFRFDTPKAPAGDVTLFIEASVPWPLTFHHYLRVRLAEADGRTLGHVFSSPDCSWQCSELYPDNDPTHPLIDSVRISEELATRWMADGALELAIELDVPRPSISCALHPEHERCFPFLAGDSSGNEGIVNSLFSMSGSSNSILSQAVGVADTTINVVSSALVGMQAALFACPPCKVVHIQVCTVMGFGREPACELLEVEESFTATALTVVRAAGGTVALDHPVGRCTCQNHNPVCEAKTTATDCTTATGTWDATTVRVVDAKMLPALDNEGEFTLRSLTLSYATR